MTSSYDFKHQYTSDKHDKDQADRQAKKKKG